MNKTNVKEYNRVEKASIVSYQVHVRVCVQEEPSPGEMNVFHFVVVTQCIFCNHEKAFPSIRLKVDAPQSHSYGVIRQDHHHSPLDDSDS